jgi:glucokinase
VGAARGIADLVYFAVDEHVHAGIVRGGAPFLGRRGLGPAAGWLALNPVEREDYRRIGCLEAEVAAAGIVRRLVWRIKSGDRSRLEDLVGGDLGRITADKIIETARGGDGVSMSVMRDTAKYLGMAAANLAVIADPDTIVVGGIMSTAADLLLEPLRVELARRLPPSVAPSVNVVAAALGPEAPAVGAARLAAAGQR